ncbi:hypothetical protein EMIT0P265_190009 [Pseudomonas zeae]
MEKRLEYFTTDAQGRELLQEYASAMTQLASLKSRATMSFPGAHGGAMKPFIENFAGVKQPVRMPDRF